MQTTHDTLTRRLDVFHCAMMQRLSAADRQALAQAQACLTDLISAYHPPKPGERAPRFSLPDQHDRTVCLDEQLNQGALIILFIRGDWCPFCTMTLRAYQAALPAIQHGGASVVAITPQPVTRCSIMAERDLLAFPTLSDQNNAVAERYGIAYDLPASLRPLYSRLGHDLPRLNGTGTWRVPLAATFVVGTDRSIIAAHVDPVSHHRLDPEDALAAVQRHGFNPEAVALID